MKRPKNKKNHLDWKIWILSTKRKNSLTSKNHQQTMMKSYDKWYIRCRYQTHRIHTYLRTSSISSLFCSDFHSCKSCFFGRNPMIFDHNPTTFDHNPNSFDHNLTTSDHSLTAFDRNHWLVIYCRRDRDSPAGMSCGSSVGFMDHHVQLF